MKQLIIILLLTAGIIFPSCSQSLSIGDTLPQTTFSNIYNHDEDTLRISDLQGKWVILDFWNTYCLSCLKAFPKIDSLQKEYHDKLQIIAVSKTTFSETKTFFDTHPNVFKPQIPFITGDSLLAQLFPHMGDPYHVWINPQGEVAYLADGYFLNRKRLDLVLAGKDASIPQAAQQINYYESVMDSTFVEEIEFASTLTRYNLHKGFRIEKAKAANEYTTSGTIKAIYQRLFHDFNAVEFNPFRTGRIQIVSDRPEIYDTPKGLEGEAYIDWMNNHAYFYQIRVPLDDSLKLFDWIKDDFERYFGLHATVESIVLDVWQLKLVGPLELIVTTGGKQKNNFIAQDPRQPKLDSIRQLKNYPYAHFSSYITSVIERITGIPCLDETGLQGEVDVSFSGQSLDQPTIDLMQAELKKHGLYLERAKKELDVIVLTDY